jgi:hypothetical protein
VKAQELGLKDIKRPVIGEPLVFLGVVIQFVIVAWFGLFIAHIATDETYFLKVATRAGATSGQLTWWNMLGGRFLLGAGALWDSWMCMQHFHRAVKMVDWEGASSLMSRIFHWVIILYTCTTTLYALIFRDPLAGYLSLANMIMVFGLNYHAACPFTAMEKAHLENEGREIYPEDFIEHYSKKRLGFSLRLPITALLGVGNVIIGIWLLIPVARAWF